jgi:hypothetical protein
MTAWVKVAVGRGKRFPGQGWSRRSGLRLAPRYAWFRWSLVPWLQHPRYHLLVVRSLTPDESTLLERRRAGMSQLLEERMPVLAHFAEVLELAEPTLIVADPDRYLPSVSEFMRNQQVTPEDEPWIMVRLAYLIGKVLIQHRHGRARGL